MLVSAVGVQGKDELLPSVEISCMFTELLSFSEGIHYANKETFLEKKNVLSPLLLPFPQFGGRGESGVGRRCC